MRLGTRGTTAAEFAIAAPAFLILLCGAIEYGRLFWTSQVLQIAGDQVARCVAIASSACSNPASYAVATATGFGLHGLTSASVKVDNTPGSTQDPTICSPPSPNKSVRVTLTFVFSSPASTLLPGLNRTLASASCYPVTGL